MAKRELSSQAAAAALIRTELKAAFPYTTFKVTSKSFSMGNDVSIHWTDGPTDKQVDAIVGKYQYGHFDGMIDMYEHSNSRDDIPQTKFVMTQRDRSDETFRAAVEYLNNHYAGYALVIREWPATAYHRAWIEIDNASDKHVGNGRGWQSQEVHRLIQKTSLVCHACTHPVLLGDAFCGECGAPLTECQECHGNGQAWNDEHREWTDDPCPVCTGTGFAPIPQRSAA